MKSVASSTSLWLGMSMKSVGEKMHFFWLFASIFVSSVSSQENITTVSYLQKYGYLPAPTKVDVPKDEDGVGVRVGASEPNLSQERVLAAVKEFQAFAGLEQTGKVDNETLELMKTPRCGVKDIPANTSISFPNATTEEYRLQGSRWPISPGRAITYRITKYSRDLSKKDIDRTFRAAFDMWEGATNLKFAVKSSGSVDIEVLFGQYSHGDYQSFDGPGGTLAHAFFPQFGGDVHMDDSETWSVDSYYGTNLLQTATHEIGHSLGLSHSNVRKSIMAPFYQGYDPNLSLEVDDVQGIQALYGRKSSTTTKKPTVVTGEPGEAEWEKREGMDCYQGKGAEIWQPEPFSTSLSLGECQAVCLRDRRCEGIIRKEAEGGGKGLCYLRRRIVLGLCVRDPIWTLYQVSRPAGPSQWRVLGGVDCYSGQGADPIFPDPVSQSLSLAACRASCATDNSCEGIIRSSKDKQRRGLCYKRKNINLNNCVTDQTWELHQKTS